MASTKIRDFVTQIQAYPTVVPVLGTSPGTEPALTIANDVIQRMLAQGLPWKFNRALVNPFLTVALQQDYIGILNGVNSINDLGWLEQCWRIDINNTAIPKPIFSMEAVRDLQASWYQSVPFQISWIPVPLAIYGTWQSNTSYPSGLGTAQTPISPIQQFIDANGNFLYVSVNGVSGTVQPVLPALSNPGTTVVDHTVTWTVADPAGVALRMTPIPATSGITWQINPVYQKKPPIKTSLTQTVSPIPQEFDYMFRAGFLAMCAIHAGKRDAMNQYAEWEEMLVTALRSQDRERDDVTLYPSESITSGSQFGYGQPIGPAMPYGPFF